MVSMAAQWPRTCCISTIGISLIIVCGITLHCRNSDLNNCSKLNHKDVEAVSDNRKEGWASLPVLLFVDVSFIFWESSRPAPSPPSLGIFGTLPGRRARDSCSVAGFWGGAADNHHGDFLVIGCLFKIFLCLCIFALTRCGGIDG